jgi:carboxymethylenebutenolidase
MRTSVAIATPDGSCPTSIFRPEGPAGTRWPAVIFYMDGFGPRPALFAMGERIAAAGYIVLLPDLFYRVGAYETPPMTLFSDPALRKHWSETYLASASFAHVMTDTAALLAHLDERHDVLGNQIGVTGYCMGGARALVAAGTFPERVAAAASFHGSYLATDAPDSPHLLAPRMRARVHVSGADQDPSFPPAMRDRLQAALDAAGVVSTVEIVAGVRHGWVPSDTPVHDPAAAERHFQVLLALLGASLPSGSAA